MPVRTAPSYRRLPKQHRMIRPSVTSGRALTALAARAPRHEKPVPNPDALFGFQTDPYLDYGRFLTDEGGVLITYKDLDTRWRYLIWRVAALASFTGFEGWFVFTCSPVENLWINFGCLLTVALVNWWIVWRPVEVYRRIEIRPDCLIIEGEDVFWSHFMEAEGLGFQPDDEGNQILCGTYGTRFVEFATLRRFDDFDRAPEVFAAHLDDAITQLWNRPVSG